jgi:hypothetical protein
VLAGPASAGTVNLGSAHGLTYVKKTEKLSGDAQSVFAECPGAKVSVGGGSSVDAPGNEGETFISSSSGLDPKGWLTEAYKRNGSFQAKLTSWAVCAGENAKVTKRKDTGAAASPGSVNGDAGCRSGDPVGGGVRTSKAGDIFLTDSYPIVNPDDPDAQGWFAKLYHTMVTDRTYTTDVSCMRGVDPSYPSGTSTSSGQTHLRVIGCSARKSIVSAGYAQTGAGPAAAHVIDARPRDLGDDDRVPDDGWAVTYHNDSGESVNYAYVGVCI